MIKQALKIAGLCLCTLGCLWFLLPVFRSSFGIGSVFGIILCLYGAGLLLFYKRISGQGGWKQVCARLLLCCYVLGLGWCGYLTVLLAGAQLGAVSENTTVVVLGSRVYAGNRLSLSLKNRVDKAGEYLAENSEADCIVTGGQGDDEPCPEAWAERDTLVSMGISEDRIYVEDRSRNTRQNFQYAREIAKREGLGDSIVVVTQGFHMYRALRLAESEGFSPHALVANTDFMMFPGYYGRELLALTKWKLEEWFLPAGKES